MGRLQNKVAIITGSSIGMGKETALLFAKEGAKVAITCRTPEKGEAVVNEITALGGEAAFFQHDVSNEASCKKLVEDVVAKWGHLDILVNNAGITGRDINTEQVTDEDIDSIFATDVKGVFWMNKYAIPEMRKIGGGSIVNFSSTYGILGAKELTPYHAAKGAVTVMTRQDEINYAKDNIRVNSVNPGIIMTPLVEQLVKDNPHYLDGRVDLYPLGRLGKPIDVAYAVLYLASDEASYVTGINLVIDGGYSAQ